ncbi:MAG TPA: TylF/MycF/NovP-related O-methyltransferase [Hanamia sp.]|jgi:Macrocin-O-methyltransferase (TylF).
MSLINKLVGKDLIDLNVRNSILTGRGNIKDFFPPDFTEEEKENISSINGMTMTSIERQVSLIRAIDYLVKNEIPGDIVECGVWKGGSMMLVAKRLLQLNDANRALFLFDTFEGMSEPGERDVNSVDNKTAQELLDKENKLDGNNVWCYSSLEEVKSNLKKTNYSPEKIFYFKGKVEQTLPEPSIGNIALLRLDTDWYESTKHELEVLYDKVVEGGVLIIDDYGHWSGSRKAVDEFIEKRKLRIFLNRIDYTGRLAIKI